MEALGLILVAGDLLLPGYGWILLSGLSGRLTALEKLTLSFIVSVAFLSLITAVLSLLTSRYLLFATVLALGFGAVAIVVNFARHPPTFGSLWPTVGKTSVPLIIALLGTLVMLILLFWSSPYYPTAEASDLLVHFRGVQAVVGGNGRDELLSVNYPIGLYFVAAVVASDLQILPLDALRILVAPILLAIISLAFSSAKAMLGSERAAGFTALVAAFVLPVDAIHFIRIGTFPNILEDAIVLTMLWLLFSYIEKPSRLLGLTLAFLGLAGAFTHSSFLIFLAVLLMSNLVAYLLFRKQFRRYLQASLFSAGGIILLALLLGSFLHSSVERLFAYSEANFLTSSVFNTTVVIFIHNLGYFYGWLNITAVVFALVFAILKKRDGLGSIFLVLWTLVLFLVPFLSNQEFRFVLFSMLPATLLMGNLIDSAYEKLSASSAYFGPAMRRSEKLIIPLSLLVLAMSGSLPGLVPRIYSPYGRLRQMAIYDSMMWAERNTCVGGVASSGLWPDYQYLPALTGVSYRGDFVRSSELIRQRASESGFSCLVVSTENPYYESFATDSRFQERYRNEMVVIFVIGNLTSSATNNAG